MLPQRGYSFDQLAAYILRRLGSPTWIVELTKQQVLDAIQDALTTYGQWRPQRRVQSIQLVSGQYTYLQGVDCGQGVIRVDFVEPTSTPTSIYYGNLIDPAPMMKCGLDEYDTFLRWRKTWMRVTSVAPDWMWDDARQLLYIHNPLNRYRAGIFTLHSPTTPQALDSYGADWVKRYALALAKFTYGELLSKYSGAVPSAAGNIQLDQGKKGEAQTEIDKLLATLQAAQLFADLTVD